MYDRQCDACHTIKLDCWEVISAPKLLACPTCGAGWMARVWLQGKANGVIDDSIPGGLWIKNGLCNDDGTPKRYDSHTEIRRAEKRTGLVNRVRHQGSKGSDKSPHTSKWY